MVFNNKILIYSYKTESTIFLSDIIFYDDEKKLNKHALPISSSVLSTVFINVLTDQSQY